MTSLWAMGTTNWATMGNPIGHMYQTCVKNFDFFEVFSPKGSDFTGISCLTKLWTLKNSPILNTHQENFLSICICWFVIVVRHKNSWEIVSLLWDFFFIIRVAIFWSIFAFYPDRFSWWAFVHFGWDAETFFGELYLTIDPLWATWNHFLCGHSPGVDITTRNKHHHLLNPTPFFLHTHFATSFGDFRELYGVPCELHCTHGATMCGKNVGFVVILRKMKVFFLWQLARLYSKHTHTHATHMTYVIAPSYLVAHYVHPRREFNTKPSNIFTSTNSP